MNEFLLPVPHSLFSSVQELLLSPDVSMAHCCGMVVCVWPVRLRKGYRSEQTTRE